MVRRVSVKIGGRERVVEIDGNGEGTRIVVDGAALAIEARRAEPGLWVLREGDGQTVALVDGDGGKVTVELRRPGGDPVVVQAEVADARSARVAALGRRAAGGASAPATVR